MDLGITFVTALLVLLLVGLVTEKVSLEAMGLGLIIVVVVSGVVDLDAALAGFANHAVITIAALYVIGEGLTRTGAVEFVAHLALAASRGREWRLVLAVGLVTGVVSAFLNNTAVVVVLTPILIRVARDSQVPASRLLIPLAYASLLGGMCTLVGTSNNLIVSGIAETHGQAPIGMFEMTPLGVLLLVLGVLFIALTARRLLPNRASLTTMLATATQREYVTEVLIGSTSPLIGQEYRGLFPGDGPKLLMVVRDEDLIWPPLATEQARVGDVVMLQGNVDQLAGLPGRFGMHLVGDQSVDRRRMTFLELAVSHSAGMEGRRIADLQLQRDYGVAVVAVLRHGQHIQERASQLSLRPGDLLLVCGDDNAAQKLEGSTDFYVLTGTDHRVVLRHRARVALGIAAAVMALFALTPLLGARLLPIPVAAMAGAMAMVACGCVTARRALRRINWPILFFIVGTLALGEAMRETHAAEFYAGALVDALASFGPIVVLWGTVLLTILLTCFVSHTAVVVLLTPIAIATAPALGIADPRPFILAVAFGSSIAFATPLGHQVCLMVYGPGGYRFTDFLRLGIPLTILAWIVVSSGLTFMAGWW